MLAYAHKMPLVSCGLHISSIFNPSMQITDRIFHQESINDYDAIGETNSLQKTSYSPMKNPLTFPSDFWDPKMAPESTSFPGQVPSDLRNWLRLGAPSRDATRRFQQLLTLSAYCFQDEKWVRWRKQWENEWEGDIWEYKLKQYNLIYIYIYVCMYTCYEAIMEHLRRSWYVDDILDIYIIYIYRHTRTHA